MSKPSSKQYIAQFLTFIPPFDQFSRLILALLATNE